MKSWIDYLKVYEPGKPIEEVARELGFDDLESIIKVASNENEWGPSPKAIEAIQENALEMHRYPDGGSFYLRHHLAKHLNVDHNQILFGNGSNELIVFLAHLFLEHGKALVMAEQAFAVYALATKLYQGELIQVPMQNYTHDLDAMLRAITPNTKLIVLVNPNNPTGTAVEPEALIQFVRAVPEHVMVIIDEAYIEIMPSHLRGDTLSLIRDGAENVIILRTFSKGYGLAGLRIGYGVAHQMWIERLNRIRQPFNVNAMAQVAAIAAIDDTEYLEKTSQLTQQGCQFLTDEIKNLGFEIVPSAANFIMVKVGEGRRWFEDLQREKVIVRPLDGYGLPDHIRITVGTLKQNKRTVEAIRFIQQKR